MKFSESLMQRFSAFVHFNMVEMRLLYVCLFSYYQLFTDGTTAMVEEEVSLKHMNQTSMALSEDMSACIKKVRTEVRYVILWTPPWELSVHGEAFIRERPYFGVGATFYAGVVFWCWALIRANWELSSLRDALGQPVRDFRHGAYLVHTLKPNPGHDRRIRHMVMFGCFLLCFALSIACLNEAGVINRPHITFHVMKRIFVPSVLLLLSCNSFRENSPQRFGWVKYQPDVFYENRGVLSMLTQTNQSFSNKIGDLVLRSHRQDITDELQSACDAGTFEHLKLHLKRPLLCRRHSLLT